MNKCAYAPRCRVLWYRSWRRQALGARADNNNLPFGASWLGVGAWDACG